MSTAASISLLGYLDTPILVGDPQGCIVYANRSFCSVFCEEGDDPVGRPLATIFGGGAREVVLSATASVLERGQSTRLQLREAGRGYAGLASPIEAEENHVGVIMVLLEEHSNEDMLAGLSDEVAAPLAAALHSVQLASSQLQEILLDEQRELLDGGLRSIEEAQRRLRELHQTVRGGKRQQGRFDVGSVVLRVADRARQDFGDALDLETLIPPNLPRVAGSPAVFERLLGQLLRTRLGESRAEGSLTLLARTLAGDPARGVLVSLVDAPDAARRESTGNPPELVAQGMLAMGGEAICVEDSVIGRVTSMRLATAST